MNAALDIVHGLEHFGMIWLAWIAQTLGEVIGANAKIVDLRL